MGMFDWTEKSSAVLLQGGVIGPDDSTSIVSPAPGERSRHVAGFLIDAAQDLARRFLRTAPHLEGARIANGFAGSVEQLVIVHDLAGRVELREIRAERPVHERLPAVPIEQ